MIASTVKLVVSIKLSNVTLEVVLTAWSALNPPPAPVLSVKLVVNVVPLNSVKLIYSVEPTV